MIRRSILALAAALAAGCSSGDSSVSSALSQGDSSTSRAGGNKYLTVMTRNLYVGGDLFLPFTAADPLLAASTVWGEILASDPVHRMAAVAREIEAARPDVVSLQEAYRFVVTPLGAAAPVLLDLDYLAALEAGLAGVAPRFTVVAEQAQTTLTLPFPDQGVQITMIDRDAILVGNDVLVRSVGGGSFDAHYSTTLAGVIPVDLKRGWAEAELKHQGIPFTFVATHLEVKEFGPLQALQAGELLARFGPRRPVIVAGDLNSDPLDPAFVVSPHPAIPTPYQVFASAFRDVAGGVGDTCCFEPDLVPTTASTLDERIDLVLVRGAIQPVSAYRIGTDPLDALGGRYPSDHAGVVAVVRLLKPWFEDGRHPGRGDRDDDPEDDDDDEDDDD